MADLILFIVVFWAMMQFVLVVHEYGHIVAMHRYGLQINCVFFGGGKLFSVHLNGLRHEFGLFPFWGGVVSTEYAKAPALVRSSVALAGLVATAIGGGVFWLLAACYPEMWVWPVLAKGSLVFLAFNAFPLPPMDGFTVFVEPVLEKRGIKLSKKAMLRLSVFGVIASTVVAFLV